MNFSWIKPAEAAALGQRKQPKHFHLPSAATAAAAATPLIKVVSLKPLDNGTHK